MTNIRLDVQGKRDAQIFIENLQSAGPNELDKLISSYKLGSEPAWHRFVKGAYNHPITWWIGLLQIQMQLGLWGHTRKAQAQLAANQLAQTLNFSKDNASKEILYKVLVYNLKHRKADVLGRFAGGAFTTMRVQAVGRETNYQKMQSEQLVLLTLCWQVMVLQSNQ